jgi:hypothetical protein
VVPVDGAITSEAMTWPKSKKTVEKKCPFHEIAILQTSTQTTRAL